MKRITLSLFMLGALTFAQAQQFEAPQIDTIPFTKVSPYVGGAFALQFQGLHHSTDSVVSPLVPLGKGFNLPTANFTIGAYLAPGMQVVLETYLSARHHNEAWVKGGYLLIDKMPFIKFEPLDKAMDYLTLKVGVMELNYGDANFRRTDNGNALKNPFVGNYVMNAFTTAPAAELYFRHPSGFLATGGVSQTIVNQVIATYDKTLAEYQDFNTIDELSYHAKIGYDKQLNEDLRLRGTVSFFTGKNHSMSLYNGDRGGSRYYLVMNEQAPTAANNGTDIKSPHLTGDFNPTTLSGLTDDTKPAATNPVTIKNTSVMVNIFAEFKGFEVFGIYEIADGTNQLVGITPVAAKPGPPAVPAVLGSYKTEDYKFTQMSIEALYHFGGEKQFYVGGRYNTVQDQKDQKVIRIQTIAGWKLTQNIVAKCEYVNQVYSDFAKYKMGDAGFEGFMLEAAISF